MTDRADLDRRLLDAVERLGRALRLARQRIATDRGVSVLQLQIVERIAHRGAGRIGDLAAALDVSQPTISDAVASLEDKGLVRRRRDPADRRVTTVELTATGVVLAGDVGDELAALRDAPRETATDQVATALEVVLREIARLQRNGIITEARTCLTCHHFEPGGDGSVARCLLLAEDLPPAALRVDCPDHLAATAVGEGGGDRPA